MNYVKIGEKIRKYRKENGISQEELAEKVGISVTHMSHIETANTKLSLPVFVSVTRALGLKSDDLLSDNRVGCDAGTVEEISNLLSDCSEKDMRIILDVVKTLKRSLKTD